MIIHLLWAHLSVVEYLFIIVSINSKYFMD